MAGVQRFGCEWRGRRRQRTCATCQAADQSDDARTVPGSPVWRALTVVRLYSRTWYVLVQLHGCTTSTTSYLIVILALLVLYSEYSTGTVVRYPS